MGTSECLGWAFRKLDWQCSRLERFPESLLGNADASLGQRRLRRGWFILQALFHGTLLT